MGTNPQFRADSNTFNKQILNRKLFYALAALLKFTLKF